MHTLYPWAHFSSLMYEGYSQTICPSRYYQNLLKILQVFLVSEGKRRGQYIIWSYTLLKQDHLSAVAQDNLVVFEHLQVWRLHSLPGQSLPVLSHPRRKKCFLMFRRSFLCFTFCPLPLVLLQGTTESSLMLSSSFPLSSSMSLLFTLPSALNSTTISWLLQPWLPLTFTSPTSHSLWAWSPAQHLFSLTLPSLRKGNYHQCTPGTSWMLAFLCAVPPEDIRVSEAMKTRLVNVRLLLSACRGSDKGKLTETSE